MGCSDCCAPPAGMRRRCVMTCAPMWWSSSAIRRRSSSSTRRGFSRKGPSRSAWRASIQGRRGGLRTARLASSWPMPVPGGGRFWTARSTCPKPGRRIGYAVAPQVFLTRSPLPPRGELAQAMLARAFAAEVPAAWVTGDEVYGNDGDLRRWLEGEGRSYVLAVARSHAVWHQGVQVRVEALLAAVPEDGWQHLDIGAGSKGPR